MSAFSLSVTRERGKGSYLQRLINCAAFYIYVLKARNFLLIFIPGEKERCFLYKRDRIALRYVNSEQILNCNIYFSILLH
jgi:hypothetical protein